ncbi:AAA family ATPase [Massilia dura]|uniref:AAA family ATPase n=2 Tax=Pseudoduganella dura TaxID=321982 RepID=A0A6I3XBX4_9BURK|nr:AAA family ATPase [Pseudoduganella dura]
MTENVSGFKLGKEDDGARQARELLEKAKQVAMPFDRSKQSGERTVQIRCGADIRPQAINWLWPGWLPAGKLTILAGAAGTGKTTLALALAAVITGGGRWPDGTVHKQRGNVLIWSSEDVADDTLVPRLMASGADLSRCHFIEGIAQDGQSVPFDPAQDIAELHRAVSVMGGVSLLLIDPIVSAVAGDMHRANDVRRSLQAVVDFAEAHDCAVIGITHFAKGGAGRDPQDRVIGSQAFGALARMVLVTAKEDDGSRRVLARAKSNIAPDDGGVAYNLDLVTLDGGIVATHAVWDGIIEGTAREILGEVEVDEDGDSSTRDELKHMLIDTIKDAGGSMAVKLLQVEVRDAGHSWDTAKRLKKELGIESSKLSMGGPWVWRLPVSSHQTIPEESTKSAEQHTQKTVLPSLPSHTFMFPSAVGGAEKSAGPAAQTIVREAI